MSVCVVPDISFTQGSTALLLQFAILQEDASGALVPMPDAATATVTWLSPNGQTRVLSAIAPTSAVFGWITQAREFPSPRTEIGRCRVSTVSGGLFWTQPFTVQVNPVF